MTQDSLPVSQRADAGGDTPAPSHGVPPPLRLTHPTPALLAWLAVAVAFCLVAGGFRRLTAPADLATLLSGAVVSWYALRPATRRFPAPDRIDGKGALAWGAVLVAFGLWELYAALRGSTHAHPTLSILIGPLIRPYSLRTVGYAVWLAAGVWVVRR